MKIVLLENSNLNYDGNDRNNSSLRGAELAIINYSEELVNMGHDVTVLNNCEKNCTINRVKYFNLLSKNYEYNYDIAISNADANLFKYIKSKKNFLLSHSIQNFEKFLRNKQLIPFIKYKPIVLCFSNYHYNKRSFLTSFYGKEIIIPSIDNDFFDTKIENRNNKDVIFYSRSDRNSHIVIETWKKLFAKYKLSNRLFVSTDLNISDIELKNYNIFKKPYLDKVDLINFLKGFRLSIIPGHKGEVFCNVAEESKALGIPIISLGYGALKERVNHKYNGILCDNENEFAEKLYELLKDDLIYQKLKKNLISDRGKHRWKNTVKDLCKLFIKI